MKSRMHDLARPNDCVRGNARAAASSRPSNSRGIDRPNRLNAPAQHIAASLTAQRTAIGTGRRHGWDRDQAGVSITQSIIVLASWGVNGEMRGEGSGQRGEGKKEEGCGVGVVSRAARSCWIGRIHGPRPIDANDHLIPKVSCFSAPFPLPSALYPLPSTLSLLPSVRWDSPGISLAPLGGRGRCSRRPEGECHAIIGFAPSTLLVAAFVFGGMLMQHDASRAQEPAKGKLKQVSEYDRPAKMRHQSRSATVASHGIVAASVPLAAQVGLDILKAGGTAADAAIATDAMLGLTEPMSCGMGGDLFCIYWDNKTQKLYGLNASGRSPYAYNREVFEKKGMKFIPGEGVLSWSVPGCVDGWDQLHSRFGALKLSQLLAPAIQYAEEGFPVTEIIAGFWKQGERIAARYPEAAATYYPNGRAPRMGELFHNPNLAASLRLVAEGGRDAFYRGPIARQIVEFSQSHGGYFSMKDFEDHTSTWVEPVSTNYRGYDVWELPPNGQGIAALEILNILEGYDIRSMGRHSPDYLHLFIEAKKLAYADRAKFYADPAFNKLPVAQLISKEYAARQRKRIDLHHAATSVDAGDPLLALGGDTIYLSVVDKDRNCCSFIQSNFAGFGSRVVPGSRRFRDAKPRLAVLARPQAFQHARAAQAALPHDHPRDGHEKRQAVVLLRRDGRRHAAAGARAGARQHDRLRSRRAGGRR